MCETVCITYQRIPEESKAKHSGEGPNLGEMIHFMQLCTDHHPTVH